MIGVAKSKLILTALSLVVWVRFTSLRYETGLKERAQKSRWTRVPEPADSRLNAQIDRCLPYLALTPVTRGVAVWGGGHWDGGSFYWQIILGGKFHQTFIITTFVQQLKVSALLEALIGENRH